MWRMRVSNRAPSPPALPLLVPFPLRLFPPHIGPPRLVVLGQLRPQYGGKILNGGIVRQTGRKADNRQREFISTGLSFQYELKVSVGLLTYAVSILLTFGTSLAVGWMVTGKNRKIDMVEALKGAE